MAAAGHWNGRFCSHLSLIFLVRHVDDIKRANAAPARCIFNFFDIRRAFSRPATQFNSFRCGGEPPKRAKRRKQWHGQCFREALGPFAHGWVQARALEGPCHRAQKPLNPWPACTVLEADEEKYEGRVRDAERARRAGGSENQPEVNPIQELPQRAAWMF